MACICGEIHFPYGCDAYQEANRALWRERKADADRERGYYFRNREARTLGAREERTGCYVRMSAAEFYEYRYGVK